jgi:hypothetical protein
MVVCLLPGPVLHLGPSQCYVERILRIAVLQRGLLFLCHFWPLVPAVWYIYILEEIMFEVFFCFFIGFQIVLSSLLR